MKKVFIILFTTLFIISCQVGKEDLKNFSANYTQTVKTMKEKMAKIKERDEYSAFKVEKQKAYETLLKKYEKSPNIEGIEILRTRILIELEKYPEAEKKIDLLLAEKPDAIIEAKMVKVLVLIKMAKYNDAYLIFKEIESSIKNPEELYEAYFNFAFMLDDNAVKKLYSEKFLNAKDLPEEQKKNRYLMYSNLAAIATIDGKSQQSREILKKGIAETTEERAKLSLEKQLAQLDFIGKEAIPLVANNWINSAPIKWNSLKGKVVIVYFWAPWCPPCRALLPAIVDEYSKNKDKGLMVIGITKLTGKYEDDEGEKGQVNEQEELELIKKYMARKGVEFPVVYTGVNVRVDLDNYKVTGIPTQVFINKKGICDFIKTGSGGELFIRNRIKKLLAE